jgi:hypothetical protein
MRWPVAASAAQITCVDEGARPTAYTVRTPSKHALVVDNRPSLSGARTERTLSRQIDDQYALLVGACECGRQVVKRNRQRKRRGASVQTG